MAIDLKGLNRRDLMALSARIEKALKRLEKADKKKALEAAAAAAKAHGFSLADLTGAAGKAAKATAKPRKATKKSVPKYQHPTDANITWTGRGRRPAWINEALAAGKDISKFAIK